MTTLTEIPKLGEDIVIYGAGGHAKELSDQLMLDGWKVKCFVDDIHSGRFIGEVPVIDFDSALAVYRTALWFVAIGEPESRHKIVKRIDAHSLRLGTFVSSRAHVLPSALIGRGVQIFAGSIISASVIVGDHCVMNFSSSISHDCEIGPFSTICPAVSIAGHVGIGAGAFVGIGATIRNGSVLKRLLIGRSSIIGAGSTVIDDIGDGTIVAGSPARRLNSRPVHEFGLE